MALRDGAPINYFLCRLTMGSGHRSNGAQGTRGLSWAAAPKFFSPPWTGPGPGLGVLGQGAPGASQGGPPLEIFFVWVGLGGLGLGVKAFFLPRTFCGGRGVWLM